MNRRIPPIYEVETRLHFVNLGEFEDALPIFQPFINQEVEWHTIHYSPALFQADQILRINHTIRQGKSSSSLGWKEPDQGRSVNIRVEMEEDITQGIQNSDILAQLGGKKILKSSEAVAAELVDLGYPQFMEYSGKNIIGEYEPQGFHLKLMLSSNPPLRYPLLFEIEKTACSLKEAAAFEREIVDFIRQYRLEDRVMHEEPPTLLYQALNLG